MNRLKEEKLAQYEDPEEQGRLIELPCRVGDTWEKNKPQGFLNAKKMPLKGYENISIFYSLAGKTPNL